MQNIFFNRNIFEIRVIINIFARVINKKQYEYKINTHC